MYRSILNITVPLAFYTIVNDCMIIVIYRHGNLLNIKHTMTASIPNEAAIVTRISWAVESARKLVHGMVVLVMVGGLRKRERHCLCKVVIGRGEAGRESTGALVQTAHMSRGGASGVCSSGGKLVVYHACEKMEGAYR